VVAAADFNSDGDPDYLLYDAGTRQTAIWYLNNNVYVGGGYGLTVPAGWNLIGIADFDGDGHTDYALWLRPGEAASTPLQRSEIDHLEDWTTRCGGWDCETRESL
jgi:FG-GAP-like repeat